MCLSVKAIQRRKGKKAEKEWPVDPDAHISTWGDTKTSTAVVSKNEHHSHINHHSKKGKQY